MDGRKFDPSTGRDTRNYAPDPQVDYQHLRLDISMPDPMSRSFRATQTLRFMTPDSSVEQLELDAVGLKIEAVRDSAGNEIRHRHDGERLRVTFEPALPARSEHSIRIDYTCSRPTDGMIFALPDEAYKSRPLHIHTQGQPESNRHWFVSHDYPNERLTSEVVVTIPSRLKALSNGALVERKELEGGLTRWHYRLGKPHVPYLVSLVIGEFDVVTDMWRDVPLEHWVPPGQAEGVQRTFGKTGKMMDLFSELTGVPYPYEKYSHAVVYNFRAGGMENTSATTLTETAVLDERAAIDQDLEGLIAHELAHQWFGDMITCRNWSHLWLNEGFATFFDAVWHEHEYGPERYAEEMWGTLRRAAANDNPEARGGLVWAYYEEPGQTFGRGVSNPYGKGSAVLHILRQELGNDLFWKGIRLYVSRHAWGNAESDDLRRAMEEVSGRSLERFFQQWVYRPGCPKLTGSFDWDEKSKTVKLKVEQTQDISEKSPAFALNIPVWLVAEDGEIVRTVVRTDTRVGSNDVPMDSEPAMVCFDPEGAVIAQWKMRIPGKMQRRIARDGPTPMSRMNAIADLSESDTDDARQTLRSIVSDPAENWVFRVQAADALGKMQTPEARDLLLEMLRDADASKDHRTRRAIVEAVGNYRHEDCAMALLRLAEKDPSSAVQSSAVAALGKQDGTDLVVDVLLKACDVSSYRDQVRVAAVGALAALDEKRGIAPAMKLASYGMPFRSRPRGVDALGRLGRIDREDPTIREFLETLLWDPEDDVRMRACSALGQIADERSIEPLRRLSRSSAPDDVRRAASSAIDTINSRSTEHPAIQQLRERVSELEKKLEKSEKASRDTEEKQTDDR